MNKSKLVRLVELFLISLCIVLLGSCQTANPYHRMINAEYDSQSIYEFNKNQRDLLIYIDGSGLNSVLGIKKNEKWESVGFSYFLVKNLDNDVELAIPEKLDYKLGYDYKNDKESLKKYTVENLIISYSHKIDALIDSNSYHHIYLMGVSEGGLLAPKILNTIKNKAKIEKMIIWGSGGYSQKDCFKVLAQSKISMPDKYRDECIRLIEVIADIEMHPDSIEKYYMGWPYSRWYSFFKYSPINEYREIDIPVLFVQGLLDFNSPYESVKCIEEMIKNSKYEFKYYPEMGHIPSSDEEMKAIIKEIYTWIKK